MKVTVHILNNVECMISPQDARTLKPCLSYRSLMYIDGPFKKKPKEYVRSVIWKVDGVKDCFFYTGLLNRVKHFCKDREIELSLNWTFQSKKAKYVRPNVEGITFRRDQMDLLRKALNKQRGYIVSGTGTGKTLLMLGIISSFPGKKFLCLAHELTLLEQFREEALKRGFNVGLYHGQDKNLVQDIIISTRQTWIKLKSGFEFWSSKFDGIIIDECHHVAPNGQYSKILCRTDASLRFGVTATDPKENEEPDKFFELNGLVGPFLGEFSLEEAIDEGVLVPIKLRLKKLPYHPAQKDIRGYNNVYERLVVFNDEFNTQVINDACEDAKNGLTSIVFVHDNTHGKILYDGLIEAGLKTKFMYGDIPGEERIKTRNELDNGELDCVVANVVWMEGINIKSLGSVINAGGGKTNRRTLQKIGRGLRSSKGKEYVILRDYFNPNNNYLVDHFTERLILYMDKGWV